MQRNIVRTVVLLLLTVMTSRNSTGQMYSSSSGDHSFRINVTRTSDDSVGVTTVIYEDGPLYVIQLSGEKVLNLSVNGRVIPQDSLGRFKELIDSVRGKIKVMEVQARRDRAQAELDRQQAGRDRDHADRDRELANGDRELANGDRERADRDRELAEVNRQQAEVTRQQARIESERAREQADRMRVQADGERQRAARDREQAERDREQAGRDREQAGRDREQAERDRKRAAEDRAMMDSLMKDLVQDGVVADRYDVRSLELHSDGVWVNGKRLPEKLEKKYLDKYAGKGRSMSYHND
jgi:hypothetical protein